jgi:hypothetical protein
MVGFDGWRRAGFALGVLALAVGCENKPADTGGGAAECAAMRDRAERANKRWVDLVAFTPPPDAPLTVVAKHTESVAKAAQEIGADFAKSPPKRADLAESAQGVGMLGELTGKRLSALARTLSELDGKLPGVTKVEGAANEAAEGLGRDIAGSVGCDKPAGACTAVIERAKELDHAPAPIGFEAAALASRSRADTLSALAKAVEALPPAPPKQKAREEMVKHARAAADAFLALGKALDELTPFEARLGKERREADEAQLRFTLELEAAAALCAPKGAGSASAASAAPTGSAGPKKP